MTVEPDTQQVETAESAYHLARLLIDGGRFTEAADVLPAALDRRPDRASELGALLFALAESGVDDALPLLQLVAEHAPGDSVLHCRLGELLLDYGDAARAARYIARAAGIEPAADDPWQSLYKAIALIRLKRVGEAEVILLRLLERKACFVETTYHLAQLLIAQDRLDEAVPRLKAVIEPGPDEAASQRRGEFTDLVFQLAEKGEPASVPLLRTIVEHAQADIVATYRMGEALESFGEPAAAEVFFERAALTIPPVPNPWQLLYRAIALVRTGRLAEAETELTALLLVDKHPIETVYNLCQLLIRRNRLAEAAAVLVKEVESSIHRKRGAHRVTALAALAVQLVELGVSDAMLVLERLANLAPDDIVVRYRLATAIAFETPAEAIPHFQRAAAADPGPDAEPRLCQALALLRLDRIDDAESALLQLRALHPRKHDAVFYLAGLYLDHGRPAEALSLLAPLATAHTAALRRSELSVGLHRVAQAGFKEAVPLLRQLTDLPPSDVASQYRLADALSMFGDTLDATRYFTLAADATPAATDVWGWLCKAQALERLRRPDDAEAALRFALTLDSPPIEIAHHLIQLLIRRNRLSEAAVVLAEAEASVRRLPGAPRVTALASYAAQLVELGGRDAMPVLERLADLAPDDVVLRYRLAVAIAVDTPSQGMLHFQRVAAADPGPDAEPRLCQALALLRLDRIDDAESALLQLRALHPRKHDAVFYLAGLYLDHGRPAEALSLLASFVGTAHTAAVSRRSELSHALQRCAQAGFKEAVPLLRQLADLPPGDVASQYRVADALSMFGDTVDATRYFTLAADATPAATDVWAWLYKAQALERLGRAGESEAVLRSLLSLDAPPIEITYHLIQLLMRRSRLSEAAAAIAEAEASMRRQHAAPRVTPLASFAVQLVELGVREALPVLERLADLAPDDIALRYRLATAIAVDTPSQAMLHFERAAAIDPGTDAEPRLFQALALLRLKRIDDAEAAFLQLRALQPRNHDAVIQLSELYLEHGRPAEALSLLASFVRTADVLASRRHELTHKLHRLAQAGFQDAVPLLRELADLPPFDITSRYQLADASSIFGDAAEATRCFTLVADATPAATDVWGSIFKAQALERLGRADDAEAVLRSALTLDSAPTEVAYHLIQLLIGRNRLPEAAAVLAEVESSIGSQHAGHRVAALASLAVQLVELGVREATAVVERLADLAPDDIVVRYRLATAIAPHAPSQAVPHFERAAAAVPGPDAEARLYQALALLRLGRIDDAESALLQLRTLQPRNHDAVIQLSELYLEHGRPAEALSLLASFIGTADVLASRRHELSYKLHRLAQAGFQDAVPLLRELADLPPFDITSRYQLADASSIFGDAAEATRCFTLVADATPAATDVWGTLFKAQALERLGRAGDAEAVLRSALTLESPPIEFPYHLIQLLIGQNRLPEAAMVLAQAESSLPRWRGAHSVTSLASLAVQLVELGVREATAVVERLADLAPDDIVVRYRLASAIAPHAAAQAMPHFERAAAAVPGPGVEPRLCQALALVRLGRIDDAESALLQLRTLYPRNHDVVLYLAGLYLDHARPADALSLLAPVVGPAAATRRTELSVGLHRVAQAGFQDAVPLLRQLTDLPPADIASQYRLADAFSMFGDTLDATRYFTLAADATPAATDVWGWFHKAQALERLGRAGEAEAVLRSTWTLDSPPTEIAYSLVDLLIKAERFAEAAAVLEDTIATPRPRTAWLMLHASALAARGVESADSLVQRIVELNASDERALTFFAQVAYQFSRPHDAMAYIARAQALSNTNTEVGRIDRALMLPFVLSSDDEIPFWVDRFTRGADALIGSGIKVENPLASIAIPPYFQVFTFGANTRDLYRKAARVWQEAHPALTWTAPHCLTWRDRLPNKRLRIGFYTQPTFPLVWGIARALDRNEFEVVHLHERCYPFTPRSPWLGAADRHVEVPNTSIAEAQRVIGEQELDVLVHMPYTNLRYFLSHARLAPVQCVLCEPCYTDGIDNLDYYISWDSAEPEPLEEWYSCAVALMRSAPYWVQRGYTRPPVDLPRSEFPLPPEAHWYLCPSTPVKMQPRFDRLIARILAEDPQGVFVLLRGDIPMGRFALDRIRRAVGPAAADRVHALPTLKEEQAHALIGLADSVLDSWPMGGMSSAFAAIYSGVPTVTLPENIPFGRWLTTMYEAIGVTDLIASTPDEYVHLALRLARDPAWKAGLADRIRAGREIFVENHAAVREIESFLREAVSAARRGDAPRHWSHGRFKG